MKDSNTAKYNELVRDYNELTKSIVGTDRSIEVVGESLAKLDGLYQDYADLRKQSYELLDAKQCEQAKNKIDLELRQKHKSLIDAMIAFVQGALRNTFNLLEQNHSAYKNGVARKINFAAKRTAIEKDLQGLQTEASFSFSRLVEDYNPLCAKDDKPEVKTPTKLESTSAPTRPDYSELKEKVVTSDSSGRSSVISRDEVVRRY